MLANNSGELCYIYDIHGRVSPGCDHRIHRITSFICPGLFVPRRLQLLPAGATNGPYDLPHMFEFKRDKSYDRVLTTFISKMPYTKLKKEGRSYISLGPIGDDAADVVRISTLGLAIA